MSAVPISSVVSALRPPDRLSLLQCRTGLSRGATAHHGGKALCASRHRKARSTRAIDVIRDGPNGRRGSGRAPIHRISSSAIRVAHELIERARLRCIDAELKRGSKGRGLATALPALAANRGGGGDAGPRVHPVVRLNAARANVTSTSIAGSRSQREIKHFCCCSDGPPPTCSRWWSRSSMSSPQHPRDDHLNKAFPSCIVRRWAARADYATPADPGPDGSKRIKRHGALGVHDIADGHPPGRMFQLAAAARWGTAERDFSKEQAIPCSTSISPKIAVGFDMKKAESLNAHYIREAAMRAAAGAEG